MTDFAVHEDGVRPRRQLWLPRLRWTSAHWLGLTVLVTLVAPFIYRRDPAAINIRNAFAGPSAKNLLGTDALGRDELARLLSAGRVSLSAGVIAVATALFIGLPIGLIAGYFGGRTDRLARTLIDTTMSFPPLILIVVFIGVTGPGLLPSMLGVGVVYSVRIARLARGMTLSVREEAYVDAARSVGCSNLRIIRRHILRNMIGPVIVEGTLLFGSAVIAEASLSYVGLGVQPPTASWGLMLREGSIDFEEVPLLVLIPGAATMILVLAANAAGDRLRRLTSEGSRANF